MSSFISLLQKVKPEHQNNLCSYLLNRTITLDDICGKGKIDSRELTNIVFGTNSKKLTKALFTFGWRAMPSVGDGEAFLSLVLDKGKKPSSKHEKGDLLYGDKEIEVKGLSGRLMGQSGYGGTTSVVNKLKHNLQYILKQLNSDKEYLIPDEGIKYNVTKLKPGAYFTLIKNAVKDRGSPLTYDEKLLVSSGYVQAINVLLESAYISDSLFIDIIPDSCDLTEDILQDFNIILLKQFYKYYYQIEHFDYMCLINNKTNELLIDDALTFENKLDFYIRNNIISITNCPSLSPNAGSQGRTYAILLN